MSARAKLPSFTVADVSTAHITPKDSDILKDAADVGFESGNKNPCPLTVLQYEYGYMVGLWPLNCMDASEEDKLEVFFKLMQHGFSTSFIAVCKSAADAGHKWLCLDQDAGKVDGLTEHEW